MSLNTELFIKINHFAEKTPQLHAFFLFVANYAIVLFAVLLLAGYYLARKKLGSEGVIKAAWAGLATLLAVGINQPLVHLFHEKRPFVVLQHILVLTHRSQDFSFPSDHTVMAGAVTTGLFLYSPILGAVSFVLALLLAFARVYIAAHWPQDVLAGFVVGAAVALIGYALLKKPLRGLYARLLSTPLRVLLIDSKQTNSDHEL